MGVSRQSDTQLEEKFVVATVNGYAYQAIWNLGGADWKKHENNLAAEQQAVPWYTNLRRALTLPHYFIEKMKGGPLHGVWFVITFFRMFRRYPAIVHWEKSELPYVPCCNRTLASA